MCADGFIPEQNKLIFKTSNDQSHPLDTESVCLYQSSLTIDVIHRTLVIETQKGFTNKPSGIVQVRQFPDSELSFFYALYIKL
jgi:hypothetical protein